MLPVPVAIRPPLLTSSAPLDVGATSFHPPSPTATAVGNIYNVVCSEERSIGGIRDTVKGTEIEQNSLSPLTSSSERKMEAKIVVVASILCTALLVQNLVAEPLEDQLPDTTGLFFGKRRSHSSRVNLNRRSFGSSDIRNAAFDWRPEASRFCAMVHSACAQWGAYDDN